MSNESVLAKAKRQVIAPELPTYPPLPVSPPAAKAVARSRVPAIPTIALSAPSSSPKGNGRSTRCMPTSVTLNARTSSRRKASVRVMPQASTMASLPSRSTSPAQPARRVAPGVPTIHPLRAGNSSAKAERRAISTPVSRLSVSVATHEPTLHAARDIQVCAVGGLVLLSGERQFTTANHKASVLSALIDEIREQWRRRQSWHRAEKSLTLAAKAMCRRLVAKGDEKAELKAADALYAAALGNGKHALAQVAFGAIAPLVSARDGIEGQRKAVEKRLAALAVSLPVAPYVATLRGVGIGSLAAIVGEAGDLSNYSNPAKLWKRMGLAVMPDGRQRKVTGAAAIEHGYSPQRRSVMWNVGECIVKAGGDLRKLYDERKLIEHQKAAAEGLTVAPSAKIPKASADKFRSEGHIHNRAKRYVEKRVLRDLWRAWRDATGTLIPTTSVRSSESPKTEADQSRRVTQGASVQPRSPLYK